MIENTAILKGIGATAALGVTAGGGYFVYKNFDALHENNYLVLKSTAVSNNNEDTAFVSGFDKKEKNFSCKTGSGDAAVEFDCEISEITFSTTNKTFTLKDLNDLTQKTEITIDNLKAADKYYKVKMSDDFLGKFDFSADSVSTLEIVKKQEKTKKYASLTPQFKVFNRKIEIKEKSLSLLAEVKVVDSTKSIDGTWTNYKCAVNNETNSKACDIYNWSTAPEANTAISDLNFSNNLSKATSESNISDGKLHVVKFTEVDSDFANNGWKNSNISFVSWATNKDLSKKSFKLTPKNRLIGSPDDSTKGIFILN